MLRRALIFALFSGAYFFSFFYRSANAVIAPDLAREMGLDAAQVVLAVRPPLGLVGPVFLALGASGAAYLLIIANARAIFPVSLGGRAMSATNLFAIGGTFVLQWWMGVIVGQFPSLEVGRYAPQAYSAALAFTAMGTALSLLWYLPLGRASRVEPLIPSPPVRGSE